VRVDERYKETSQQHIGKQRRTSGEPFQTEHLEEKGATQEMLGTVSSMENAFLHLHHIEFRTTELYVCYS